MTLRTDAGARSHAQRFCPACAVLATGGLRNKRVLPAGDARQRELAGFPSDVLWIALRGVFLRAASPMLCPSLEVLFLDGVMCGDLSSCYLHKSCTHACANAHADACQRRTGVFLPCIISIDNQHRRLALDGLGGAHLLTRRWIGVCRRQPVAHHLAPRRVRSGNRAPRPFALHPDLMPPELGQLRELATGLPSDVVLDHAAQNFAAIPFTLRIRCVFVLPGLRGRHAPVVRAPCCDPHPPRPWYLCLSPLIFPCPPRLFPTPGIEQGSDHTTSCVEGVRCHRTRAGNVAKQYRL
jgi:hypothetical protein